MANTRQIPWPSPGRSRDRHRAGLTTATGQFLLALDTRGDRRGDPIASGRSRRSVTRLGPRLAASTSSLVALRIDGAERVVVAMAEPGPLIAMKLQSIMNRGRVKEATDLLDIVAFTLIRSPGRLLGRSWPMPTGYSAGMRFCTFSFGSKTASIGACGSSGTSRKDVSWTIFVSSATCSEETSRRHGRVPLAFGRLDLRERRPTDVVGTLTRTDGAPPGTRTPNPLIKSQLLCQLS